MDHVLDLPARAGHPSTLSDAELAVLIHSPRFVGTTVACEALRLAHGEVPPALLVHHVLSCVPSERWADATAVLRALVATCPVAGQRLHARGHLREVDAVLALRGAALRDHLVHKADARGAPGPPVRAAWHGPGLLNPVSGHVVRARRDAVEAFERAGVLGAAALQAYVEALDAAWQRAPRIQASGFPPETPLPKGWEHAPPSLPNPRVVFDPRERRVTVLPVGTLAWSIPEGALPTPWLPAFAVHVAEAAIRAAASRSAGAIGYLVFLMRLAEHLASRPGRRVAGPGARKEHVVVAVDTRGNVMTALSVLVALLEAQAHGFRDAVVFTSAGPSADAYRAFFDAVVPPGTVSVEAFHPAGAPFDTDAYSAFLKAPAFWRRLHGFDRALVVQDDGFLLDGARLDAYLKYDYTGAPWTRTDQIADLVGMMGNALVGNGGLSLRSVAASLALAEDPAEEPWRRALFANNQIVVPEDAYFAHAMLRRGARLCPWAEARGFAVEQVLPSQEEAPTTMGTHKVWHYHGAAGVEAVFAALRSGRTASSR